MMKKLLAVALATVMTQQALAVNWLQVSENSDGNKFYIDLDSIQKDYLTDGTPVMIAWTQIEFKQAEDAGGKKFWTAKYFDYFDCRARKFATEYYADYDKQGGVVHSDQGGVVHSFNNSSFSRYSSANWHRAVPDTGGETVLNSVCAYTN